MGTQKESFIELTERIGRKTGGLSVSPFVSDRRGTAEPLALIMISGKAMSDKSGDLLDLFRDVLLTARLDDQERFKQVLAPPLFLTVQCHPSPGRANSPLLQPSLRASHCLLTLELFVLIASAHVRQSPMHVWIPLLQAGFGLPNALSQKFTSSQ